MSIYFFSPGPYYRSNNYYYQPHYTVKTLKVSLDRFLSLAQRNHWNYVVIIIQKAWSYHKSNDSQMHFFWAMLADWVATEPWGFLCKGHLCAVNTSIQRIPMDCIPWAFGKNYHSVLVYRCRGGHTKILQGKPPTERCDPLELVPDSPFRGNSQLLHYKQCWIGSL